MTQLYYVGLEPLKERYTGAWAQWLPALFATAFTVVDVPGVPLTSSVTNGTFLDVNSSAHYKATQLAAIAKMFHERAVPDGALFWFSDIEFNGLEMVRYLARLNNVNVRIAGFLHAASYVKQDMMECMADLGVLTEPLWAKCCDAIFVGSKHSKELFRTHRLHNLPDALVRGIYNRIHVTGNPFRSWEVASRGGLALPKSRTYDIVFPHRPDIDKRPDLAVRAILQAAQGRSRYLEVAFTTGRDTYRGSGKDAMMAAIRDAGSEWGKCVKSTYLTGLDRSAFFDVLRNSHCALSVGVEETFGYAMVEAMAAGCLPVVPWEFAYPEYAMREFAFLPSAASEDNPLESLVADALRCALDVSALDMPGYRLRANSQAADFDNAEWRILAALREEAAAL